MHTYIYHNIHEEKSMQDIDYSTEFDINKMMQKKSTK